MPNALPFRVATLLVVATLWTACGTIRRDAEWQGSPQVQLANTRSRPLPTATRRVLAFPVHVPQIAGPTQRELDATFETELNKQQRFEVVRVSRDELSSILGREEISSTETFPAEALTTLRQRFAPDALLLTDITAYRPYRPLAMGVRARLVDAQTMKELWAIDTTLDSAHEDVARAALAHRGGADVHPGLVLQSPRTFAAFVAQQAFATLAPR